MVYKPYYCLIVTPSKILASVIGTHLESLGWKLVWTEKDIVTYQFKEDLILTRFENSSITQINYSTGYQLFKGECKSINELKKIMSYLNIK